MPPVRCPEGVSFNGGKIAIQQAGSLSVFGAIRTVEKDEASLFSFKSALFPKSHKMASGRRSCGVARGR